MTTRVGNADSHTADRGERISKFRHPIWWVKGSWLWTSSATRFDQILLGLIGGAAFATLGALIGLILSALDVLDGKLPVSLVVAAGAVGLLAGSLIGALIARLHYLPQLHSKDAEIEKLKVYRGAMRRHEIYAKHIHLLLMQLHGNGLDNEEDSLLLEPARIIRKATGKKAFFSVWAHTETPLGMLRWKIERAPDHTERQQRAFAVPLKDSWISLMQNLKRDSKGEGERSSKDFVFGLADMEEMKAQGRDLSAFLDAGFKSLRCTSVTGADSNETEKSDAWCLVVLAEDANAFDEMEDLYIVFLGQILGLHRRMTQIVPGAEDHA